MVSKKKIGPELIKDFISRAEEGENYSFRGRVASVRKQGGITFFDLVDHTGSIQVILHKDKLRNYNKVSKISPGSYVGVEGRYSLSETSCEIDADSLNIMSEATLPISPTPWDIDGLDSRYFDQIFDFPGFYAANPQRSAILKIKSVFIQSLHEYFRKMGFTLVEPPILTDKILYESQKAVKATVHGESVYLSQCATFELEPLAMAYGKAYTISPAFRNEKSGSKRHLAEYTHVKAESLFVDLDDLMFLAGDAIYWSIKKTVNECKKDLDFLEVDINLDSLNPKNYASVTYDDAVKILNSKGSKIKYGEGLSREDEIILTKHMGDKYLWVKFLPFESEGFPYKRKKGNPSLSMTCDLIAPHGSGEIVGVAEKTTEMEEIIENLIEKGKKKDIKRYWKYILLRRQGLPPHGGIGAAPERIIYGLLGLDHIKMTKPWPRYPGKKINPRKNMGLNPWRDKSLDKIIRKYNLNR